MTLKAGAVSRVPGWFGLAVLMLLEEKKRHLLRLWEEIQHRP